MLLLRSFNILQTGRNLAFLALLPFLAAGCASGPTQAAGLPPEPANLPPGIRPPPMVAGDSSATAGAPTFTPFTVKPQMLNREQVARALSREYPDHLRDAGIGGRADVWVFVDENGTIRRTLLMESTGYPELDTAALEVARTVRFSSAENKGEKVAVWISFPITFSVRKIPVVTNPGILLKRSPSPNGNTPAVTGDQP